MSRDCGAGVLAGGIGIVAPASSPANWSRTLGIKNRDQIASRFEFVVTAGARARQLLKGATPRVVGGGEKAITIAQQEVSTGEVRKVEPEPAKE